jgi:hypothetical protein
MATDTATYALVAVIIGLLVAYAVRINALMASAPAEALLLAGAPLDVEEIRATKARLEKHPIEYEKYLPSAKKRRYIVVGGSGMHVFGNVRSRGSADTREQV